MFSLEHNVEDERSSNNILCDPVCGTGSEWRAGLQRSGDGRNPKFRGQADEGVLWQYPLTLLDS